MGTSIAAFAQTESATHCVNLLQTELEIFSKIQNVQQQLPGSISHTNQQSHVFCTVLPQKRTKILKINGNLYCREQQFKGIVSRGLQMILINRPGIPLKVYFLCFHIVFKFNIFRGFKLLLLHLAKAQCHAADSFLLYLF